MRSQSNQVVSGRVNGDGTIMFLGPGMFTIQRTSAGNYIVKFPGRRLISLNANSYTGTSVLAQIFPNAPDACLVQVLQSGFATVDAPFTFTATLAA